MGGVTSVNVSTTTLLKRMPRMQFYCLQSSLTIQRYRILADNEVRLTGTYWQMPLDHIPIKVRVKRRWTCVEEAVSGPR